MATTLTLGDVLENARGFDPRHFLYLPPDEVWQLSTRCTVSAQSDLDGVPDVAAERGLQYALGIAAVQDVVENARAQITDIDPDRLLQAFLFYYDHDAYIDFGV